MTFLIDSQIRTIDEQWKANHISAMACWEFQDLLLFCIEAFERINRLDEAYRVAILGKEKPYNEEEEKEIQKSYCNWLNVCKHLLDPLTKFQSKYTVEHADRFVECVREAEGIQMDDSDFFSCDNLVQLRDTAIDEHQRGETLDGKWK